MKTLFNFIFILFTSLALLSCGTTDPQIPVEAKPTLTLAPEDTSCTEVWVRLTTNDLTLPAELTLKQYNPTGDSISQILLLNTQDTLLYIDSLLPNQTYKLQVSSVKYQVESKKLSITTMDTTSHNFTFTTWTFGEHSSSILNDVAIINENDIWAVGEIYMNDSLGNPDLKAYNAVHWNGTNWELKRIMFYTFCPQGSGEGSYPAQSIFAIDDQDVLISSGSQIAYLSNGVQIKKECVSVSVNKIWSISVNDIYSVGFGGEIARYNGINWTNLESGTSLDINDIWGYSNNISEPFILCAASNFGTNDQKKLLRIQNTIVDTMNWSPQRDLFTVWFKSKYKIYAGGSGVFVNSGKGWKEEKNLPHNFTFRIRGNNYNDLYATGGLGYFAHFNGYSWQTLNEISLQGGDYKGLTTKGKTCCVVGFVGAQAVISLTNK